MSPEGREVYYRVGVDERGLPLREVEPHQMPRPVRQRGLLPASVVLLDREGGEAFLVREYFPREGEFEIVGGEGKPRLTVKKGEPPTFIMRQGDSVYALRVERYPIEGVPKPTGLEPRAIGGLCDIIAEVTGLAGVFNTFTREQGRAGSSFTPPMVDVDGIREALTPREPAEIARRIMGLEKASVNLIRVVGVLNGVYIPDEVQEAMLERMAEGRFAGIRDRRAAGAFIQLMDHLVFPIHASQGSLADMGKLWVHAAFAQQKILAMDYPEAERLIREGLLTLNEQLTPSLTEVALGRAMVGDRDSGADPEGVKRLNRMHQMAYVVGKLLGNAPAVREMMGRVLGYREELVGGGVEFARAFDRWAHVFMDGVNEPIGFGEIARDVSARESMLRDAACGGELAEPNVDMIRLAVTGFMKACGTVVREEGVTGETTARVEHLMSSALAWSHHFTSAADDSRGVWGGPFQEIRVLSEEDNVPRVVRAVWRMV